jgi:uncharacterized protein
MRRLLQEFCPALRAESITEITPALLAERGIRALILDLDNTLVEWHGREAAPAVTVWITQMLSAGVRMCILSNTRRTDRLNDLAAALGVDAVPPASKPRRGGFRRAMEKMGAAPEETAVVGDQLLTDIWGGKRCGLLTILVDPLSPIEFWGTKVVHRNLERALLKGMGQQGISAERITPPAKESHAEGSDE